MNDTIPYVKKSFRCPDCKNETFSSLGWLLKHMEKAHRKDIREDWTLLQYLFHRRNRTDEPSKCVVCKTPTIWNEEAGKYPRLCEKQTCRTVLANKAKENMMKSYGSEHLLNDPEMQKKMLQSRGISGIYKFRDGKTTINYVGSYEKDFLEFIDKEQEMDPKSIQECPFYFSYRFEGTDHLYIPDYWMPDFNLIIEIKDGGDNPNNHPKIQEVDKAKEALKDKAIIAQKKYHYIKITNKEYREFVELLKVLQADTTNSFHLQEPIHVLGA